MSTPIRSCIGSCIRTIERALSRPNRNIAISIALICVGLLAILVGNWRINRSQNQTNQNIVEQAYGEGLLAVTTLSRQMLATVFGDEGFGSVEQNQLGLKVYDTTLDAWIAFDEMGFENSGHKLGSRVVMLVHGLDEPGGIWDQLTPALVNDGHTVLQFEYANDQAIALSASRFLESMDQLQGVGVESIDLVCHSMGGLVSRDMITRDGFADCGIVVERLVTIGTPHGGSPWARMQAVSEMREQVQRWIQSDDLDPKRLMGFARDGVGQAGSDLLPGSDFLVDLDTRTMPEGIQITCIVGRMVSEHGKGMGSLMLDQAMRDLIGDREAGVIGNELEKLNQELGDGVVPMSSAVLEGVDDVVIFEANHRSMIRNVELGEAIRKAGGFKASAEPPAIAVVLDRLKRD